MTTSREGTEAGAAPASAAAPGAFGPLRSRSFRWMWLSGGIFYTGSAMQLTAASWLVTETTGSALLSALAQTAAYFPMFALSLPAGVLADTSDRRRIILNALWVYVCAAAVLAGLAAAHLAGPAVLLSLVLLMGCSNAVHSPAWRSAVTESVSRADLPQAITMASMAFNGARVIGPAIAGALFALAGGGLVFALSGFAALIMIGAVLHCPPPPHPPSRLPMERLWGGMRSGLRYVRHAPHARGPLLYTAAFDIGGSALWALLPLIAQQRLGMNATGYGLLLGCLGFGAVAVGLAMTWLRGRIALPTLLALCSLVFAFATVVPAITTNHGVVYGALLVGGCAWLACLSTLNAVVQTTSPPWVRARSLAIFTVCALGAFSVGSAVWGAVSSFVGIVPALCAAAVCLVGVAALPRWLPMRMGDDKDVLPALEGAGPAVEHAPAHEAGPVAVEVEYCVDPAHAAAFLDTLALLRAPRRRDGASLWRAYRDLSDPTRFVERFIVPSWAEYLRQRSRATLADRELVQRVAAYQRPGVELRMRHYIAER